MVRPALGAAARTEILNVRVTKAERAFLTKKWGSGGKALRSLIERAKQDQGTDTSGHITEPGA